MEDLCLFLALEILNVYNIYKKKLFRTRSFTKAFGKWENPVCMFLLAVVEEYLMYIILLLTLFTFCDIKLYFRLKVRWY